MKRGAWLREDKEDGKIQNVSEDKYDPSTGEERYQEQKS